MTISSDNSSSFGVLLKTFRKRNHLTQQGLAGSIGVHRSAIVRWEQGDFLPEYKTLVLELARHLRLDDQEARSLLEASLTALTPHWLVSLPRNPFFTGREEILAALHTQLGVSQTVALTQTSALHGLGGIGKTQIALEYAYRHALEYSAVFWIEAETEGQIVTSLLRIAETLQLLGRDDKDQQRVVAAVQHWLILHGQWLLIWDNVEDLDLLNRFLPSARSGAILITTRLQTLGTLAHGLGLLPMELEEGMLFLLRRARTLDANATCEQMHQFASRLPAEYAAASELVIALGGLPLALDQAEAYLEETRCGLPAYLELFHTRRAMLLQKRGNGSRTHLASVSTTFTLTITTTTRLHPAVRDLLQVCALLQPYAIPEELFRQGGQHLGATLGPACCDALEWNQVVAVACSYSLLSRQPGERTLSIHRLCQAVLLDAMEEAEQEQWNSRVIEAFDVMFPDLQQDSAMEAAAWKYCEQLLPHVLLCLERTNMESLALASVAYKCSQYLCTQGKYVRAEQLSQRALSIREKALGLNHADVAFSLLSHAEIFREQGRYTEAEQLYQRALIVRQQTQGLDHPLVAEPLNGLAVLYLEQGRYEQAEQLLLQSLRIREQYLGVDHPETAQSLHDLAVLRQKQGNQGEARMLAEGALHIRSQSLGDAHPKTVATQMLYARLLQEHTCAQEGVASEPGAEEHPMERALSVATSSSPSENDHLQEFLDTCCELHPRAWCRSSDLWQVYEQWAMEHQERLLLSRRVLAAQLKAFGCHVDRTNTARIWRGITLAKKEL